MIGKYRGWIAIGCLLVILGVLLLAYGGSSSNASLDSRVQSLASQLRCPACQGESVAESTSDVAISIRAVIRQRLQRGQSSQSIANYLESRYPGISLAPSTSGLGSLAWLAPPLLILGGAGLLLTLILDWRARGRRRGEVALPEYLRRVRAELAADQGD